MSDKKQAQPEQATETSGDRVFRIDGEDWMKEVWCYQCNVELAKCPVYKELSSVVNQGGRITVSKNHIEAHLPDDRYFNKLCDTVEDTRDRCIIDPSKQK